MGSSSIHTEKPVLSGMISIIPGDPWFDHIIGRIYKTAFALNIAQPSSQILKIFSALTGGVIPNTSAEYIIL